MRPTIYRSKDGILNSSNKKIAKEDEKDKSSNQFFHIYIIQTHRCNIKIFENGAIVPR
jgi:hypothetical protein